MYRWRLIHRTGVGVIVFLLSQMIAHSSPQPSRTGEVTGHVADSVGATITDASVFVRDHYPPDDHVRLDAHTDGQGNFKLILPGGGYDILITSPSFASEVQTTAIVPGKTQKTEWKLKALGCDFPGMNCDSVQ